MVAIKAHFDGKVIVPDEPVPLRPQQRIIVHIETEPQQNTDFRSWLGAGGTPRPPDQRQFRDDDDLWR